MISLSLFIVFSPLILQRAIRWNYFISAVLLVGAVLFAYL